VSFFLGAVHAARGGIYELKEFLRTQCRAVDSDVDLAVGSDEIEVTVLFAEGVPPADDEDLWRLLEHLSAASVNINRDRGEVTITVEFD
jgi:hypothetical protein